MAVGCAGKLIGEFRVWLNASASAFPGAIFALTDAGLRVVRVAGKTATEMGEPELKQAIEAAREHSFSSVRCVEAKPWLPQLSLELEGIRLTWFAEDEPQRDNLFAALRAELGPSFAESSSPESRTRVIATSAASLLVIALPAWALITAALAPEQAVGSSRHLRRNLLVGCAKTLGPMGISIIALLFAGIVVLSLYGGLAHARSVLRLTRRIGDGG